MRLTSSLLAVSLVACGSSEDSSAGDTSASSASVTSSDSTGAASGAGATGGGGSASASTGAGGEGGRGGGGGPACGARVEPYDYARPYGPDAPWNVPVCDLAAWSESATYGERFWRYAYPGGDPMNPDANRGKHGVDFGLASDPNQDFAPPVYDIADATTTRRVRLRGDYGITNLGPDETIPWNPAWRAMGGSDAVAILLDPATGREWDLWGIVQTDAFGIYNDSECWFAPGYNPATDLCVGSAFLVRRPDDATPIDYRTYTGNFPSRGVRIQFYSMVVTPEEVAAGEIRHALMMGAANTMFGPACTTAELDTPAAGTTCGYAVAPAGGLEWQGPCTSCPPSPLSDLERRSRSIPEGMRLALHVSDTEIDAWLDERGYAEPKRGTARAFAVALRDYGWFITDTAGTAAFAVSGSANPDTEAAWRALGIEGDGFDLLFGLFTKERVWVVEPATNACVDGTSSRYACPAAETGYP